MKYNSKLKTVFCFLAATAGLTGAASASNMKPLRETTQPIGHYELCQVSPSECRALRANVKPTRLTQSLWSRVIDINSSVNAMIRPVTDLEQWGREEIWSYPSTQGDCEDYVLLKRKLLTQAGIPANNLLVTVVRQMDGSGHAVLTLVTDRGDFILDNLRGEVRSWDETPYIYLKRQSSENYGVWVSLSDKRSLESVASLN
jgi:predicted transglutaminase-like cysteine proteinase